MVEIMPGVGVAAAKVGEHRDGVERRIGKPLHPGRDSRAVYDQTPLLVLTYAEDETVEVVELAHSPDRGEQVFFDGVQLTYRFLDEVVADLSAKGYAYEPTDIGYRFEPGFAIYSMGSLWTGELLPDAPDDDDRPICEGVAVAPYDYFREPSDEEIEAHIEAREKERAETRP
jgi:hypothetical protein